MASDSMPALYIGHGAPPLLDDPHWSAELRKLAGSLPAPIGILIASAHWESAPMTLSAASASTPLIYDFAGFAPRYYQRAYQTPDASALASLVASVFPAGEKPHQHLTRGLDHGAWVPMTIMFPAADIPTLQLSLPTGDPAQLLGIGARLRTLREHGVLVIGSGFLTHGLPFLRDWTIDAKPLGWSVDFDHWAAEALSQGDIDSLAQFRTKAPGMPYAHPSVEHFLPLFVTLGAASEGAPPATTTIDGFWMGLSKRSILVT